MVFLLIDRKIKIKEEKGKKRDKQLKFIYIGKDEKLNLFKKKKKKIIDKKRIIF